MAHMWEEGRGVTSFATWHGMSTIGSFDAPGSLLEHGYASNAWPTGLDVQPLFTGSGIAAPGVEAIVASYRSAAPRVVGVNSPRYRANAVEAWARLCEGVVASGGRPNGAFALSEGSKVLATFEVGDAHASLRQYFLLMDSFDGSSALCAGDTSIRVECANTVAMSMRADGASMARLRHCASLASRIDALRDGMAETLKSGERVRETFKRAEATHLTAAQASVAFDVLFPEAPEDATAAATTRAKNRRRDAIKAAHNPVNHVGGRGNLATLWNAATFLVDRTADGQARGTAGMDSMILGSRGARVEEIRRIIEVILANGEVRQMTSDEAVRFGVSPSQNASLAKSLIEDILDATA